MLDITRNPKPTANDKTPWEDRLNFQESLNKTVPKPGEKHTEVKLTMEEFKFRLLHVRDGIYQYSCSVAEDVLVQKLNEKYPALKIKSVGDFISHVEQSPSMTPELRGQIAFAQDLAWGDNNQWALNEEARAMVRFGIRFNGMNANGRAQKRKTKGRCIKNLLVKAKNSVVVEKIRNACKRYHKEALFERHEKTKKTSDGDLSVTTITTATTTTSSAKKKSPYPRVTKRVPATVDKHGFNGIIGYCEGHPSLASSTDTVCTPASVAAKSTDGSSMSSLSGGTETSDSDKRMKILGELIKKGNMDAVRAQYEAFENPTVPDMVVEEVRVYIIYVHFPFALFNAQL